MPRWDCSALLQTQFYRPATPESLGDVARAQCFCPTGRIGYIVVLASSRKYTHLRDTSHRMVVLMRYDFDTPRDRRHSDSEKWRRYPEDVLPLWVADMDFVSPEPVIRALQERVAHGIFGYGTEPATLRQVLVERMARLYNWQVTETDFVFLPGVVPGFNMACRAVASPGDAVLIQTPIYPPILEAPSNAGLRGVIVPLAQDAGGRYYIDFDLFERSIDEHTRLFILCNPHNPVGRAFEREELERMAEICLRHNIVICSDEIHCDLVFSGQDRKSVV